MKTLIKKFFDNEILSYLFFGVATTIVSVGTRLFIYQVSRDERLATAIGNIAGILFAFATNDTIVFKQERKGWFPSACPRKPAAGTLLLLFWKRQMPG